MTQISASLVKELREKTGAGMMDCKNALMEAGNLEDAIRLLREKGLARAAKKESRIAAEGLIAIEVNGSEASMLELNCETDFVARNEDFSALSKDLAKVALSYKPDSSVDPLNIDGSLLSALAFAEGKTVEEAITEKIATIGEKIAVRRFARLSGGSLYGQYIHGQGDIGVLVELNLDNPNGAENSVILKAARDIAMHVAAANPNFVTANDIPESFKQSEREIFVKQLEAEGKPANMIDKIVDGKMAKHLKEMCLLDQPFIKNPEISVQKMLDQVKSETGITVVVTRKVRFKVGEGIEKAKDDFLAEVKKMAS